MKYQVRVLGFTQDRPFAEFTVVDGNVESKGTTTFQVELSYMDMNDVNHVKGTTYITLDRLTDYTGEVKLEIEDILSVRGLLEVQSKDSLELAKQHKWNRIVAIRDGSEGLGFVYMGKEFDSDTRSVLRILGASQACLSAIALGKEFSVTWSTADNSTIELDSTAILGLPVALAEHTNALHVKAKSLKDAIDRAASIEELNLINW